MKRLTVALGMTLLVAVLAQAQIGLRNISSASVDLYFNDAAATADNGGRVEKLALDLNQVLLYRIAGWISMELKIQRQDEEPYAALAAEGWHETTLSIAPIFVVSRYNYIILRYGLGIGTGYERPAGESLVSGDVRGVSHDLTIDANYETPRMLVNLTLRGSLYPDLDYWFVLPSAGVRYTFDSGFGVYGRYFFSYNSHAAVSHALVSEFEFPVGDSVRLKVGGSGSLAPSEPAELRWGYSVITGVGVQITDALGFKYHLEYLGRENAGPGIRNVLTLDARF